MKKHPIVITITNDSKLNDESNNKKDHDCFICYELTKNTDLVQLNCRHSFCVFCIQTILEIPCCVPCCSFCRTNMTSFDVKNVKTFKLLFPYCDLYL